MDNRVTKFEKNYKKLHKIISYLYVTKCSYYNLEQYTEDYKNFKAQIEKLRVQPIINKLQITEYKEHTPIYVKNADGIMSSIFDNLQSEQILTIILHTILLTAELYIRINKQTCDKFMVHNIFLDYITPSQDNVFTSTMITQLMEIDNFHHRIIYFYTLDLYVNLDTYCVYVANNLNTDFLTYDKQEIKNITITLPNGVSQIIQLPKFNYTFDSICSTIDNIILKINQNYDKTHINEEFYVYSFQLLYGVNIINKIILNVSDFKIGDIIQLQHYVSTLFNKDAKIYEAPNKNILFKIKINKNSKCWIYLSTYSNKPTLNTILLQRNSYFVIDKISTFKHSEQELTLFEVSLFDTIEPSIIHSNNCVINDNFTYPFYKKHYLVALDYISKIRNYDIIASIRISLILYLYILYLLVTNYNPQWTVILTPRIILQICIVGLFYLSININDSFSKFAQQNQLLFSKAEFAKYIKFMDDDFLRFLFTNAIELSSVNSKNIIEFDIFTEQNSINEEKEIIDFAIKICYLTYDNIQLSKYKAKQLKSKKNNLVRKIKNVESYEIYTQNFYYCLYILLKYSTDIFFKIRAQYHLQKFDIIVPIIVPRMDSRMDSRIDPIFGKIQDGGNPDDEKNDMDKFTDYINHSTNNLYCSKFNQISTKNINTITRINCALFMNTDDKKIRIEDYNDFLQSSMMKNILQSGGNNKKLYFKIKNLF
jgi:hypothetical protein